ncbi:adenylyl-sulfate kinase, partial [Campylobacter jejuni]
NSCRNNLEEKVELIIKKLAL